jgi:hypothetical protein
MLWFMTRASESLTLETRYDNDTLEYVVIIRYPDGRDEQRRFTDASACQTWLVTTERRLASDGWTADGPPTLLSDAWPTRRPPR